MPRTPPANRLSVNNESPGCGRFRIPEPIQVGLPSSLRTTECQSSSCLVRREVPTGSGVRLIVDDSVTLTTSRVWVGSTEIPHRHWGLPTRPTLDGWPTVSYKSGLLCPRGGWTSRCLVLLGLAILTPPDPSPEEWCVWRDNTVTEIVRKNTLN